MYQEHTNAAIATRKVISKLHTGEPIVFPNSYSKLINLKEASGQNNSIISLKNSKILGYNVDRLRGRHLKPQTPSNYNIPKFKSGKSISSSQRPISVGCTNSRPAFLEPETASNHFPNKSALIGLTNIKRTSEDHEGYKFPLFRSKQIKGFRLSISPVGSDNEQNLSYVKTPISGYGGKSLNAKAPYSAVNKANREFEYTSGPYGLSYDGLLKAN